MFESPVDNQQYNVCFIDGVHSFLKYDTSQFSILSMSLYERLLTLRPFCVQGEGEGGGLEAVHPSEEQTGEGGHERGVERLSAHGRTRNKPASCGSLRV